MGTSTKETGAGIVGDIKWNIEGDKITGNPDETLRGDRSFAQNVLINLGFDLPE